MWSECVGQESSSGVVLSNEDEVLLLQLKKQIDTAAKKVKKTCQQCAKSKVKCSSTLPRCSRCVERGLSCVYVGEMKRGRKERHHGQSSSNKNAELSDSESNDESSDDSNSNSNSRKRSSPESSPSVHDSMNYAIVNGAPFNGPSIQEILESSTQIPDKIHKMVERLNREYPIQVGSRGYSKRQKKTKEEHLVAPKKQESKPKQSTTTPTALKEEKGYAKVEFNSSIQQNNIKVEATNVFLKQHQSPVMIPNSSYDASKKNDILPLSRYEIGEVEKKIFISYFDTLRHTTSAASPCVAVENLKVFEEKMAHFLASTSQVERFNNIFNEIQRNNNRLRDDVFHSCSTCCSLDAENDSFDRFSCLPSANHIAAFQVHDVCCGSHLKKIANPLSKDMYLRLDYLTKPELFVNNYNSMGENRPTSTIKSYLNAEFSSVLNYTQNEISQLHSYFIGGLLPYGGDAFALLLDDANDVKRILHRFALKTARSFSLYRMHSSGFPSACFTIETMFSVGNNKYPIRLKKRYETGESRIVPSICQILSRNIILQDGSYGGTQLHINFVPIQQTIIKEIGSTKQKADEFVWIDQFISTVSEHQQNFSPIIPTYSPTTRKLSGVDGNDLDDIFEYNEEGLI